MINQTPNNSEISKLSNFKIFVILVIIPFMQSMITGLLIGASCGTLAWIVGSTPIIDIGIAMIILAMITAVLAWAYNSTNVANAALSVALLIGMMISGPFYVQQDWPLKFGILAWILSSTVAWLPMLSRSRYMLEMWLGIDLDFDGVIGDPDQQLQRNETVIRAEVKTGRNFRIANIKADPKKLEQLARALQQSKTLSHSRFVGSDKLFGRQEWDRLIIQLEQNNLIKLKNPAARHLGFDITDEGTALFEKIGRGVEHTQAPYQMPEIN